MPENEYCLDNFFYKMTDLESPKKNNDCYFYYYSTCTKGDRCMFRHEPSALGCETMCSFWKEGKCINIHCNFRHMELRKNRKSIPCYWESQPGGCKKPHCPFLHLSPKSDSDNGETSNIKSNSDLKEADLLGGLKQSRNDDFGPAVDPLVVNFEEESDNESAPSQSPVKTQQQQPQQQQQQRVVKVKTLEEIKLERIQAESAAYYSYEAEENIDVNEPSTFKQIDEADFLRSRIINRLNTKSEKPETDVKNIEILSLDEIRKRKRSQDTEPTSKKPKISLPIRRAPDLSEIKVKTLAEIKAERALRFGLDNKRKLSVDDEDDEKETFECENVSREKKRKFLEESDSEVSSTSEDPNKVQCVVTPVQRVSAEEEAQKKTVIKLRRAKSPIVFRQTEKSAAGKVIKLRKTDDNIDSSDDQDVKMEDKIESIDQTDEKTESDLGRIIIDQEAAFKQELRITDCKQELNKKDSKTNNNDQDNNTNDTKLLISNRDLNKEAGKSFIFNNEDINTETDTNINDQNSELKKEIEVKTTISDPNKSDLPIIKEPVVGADLGICKTHKKPIKKSVSEDTDSSNSDKLELDSSKYEQLLLEEDDEDASMTLRTDDDILNDIDSLLND